MIDALSITAFSSGIVAILIATFTHLKHSECCGSFKLDTYNPNENAQPQIIVSQPPTPHNTPQNTPIIQIKSQETNL